jgi:asparagine synthase (glutamine-hydrolysing)
MCGIGGLVGDGWEETQLNAIIRSQHHRGPDANGTFINEQRNVGLGHNRLSIIDLSSAGIQPLSNADSTLWISFNGEVYNYLELREQLTDYPYRTKTDTEVILAAYERWGIDCVDHFIGMFAFAIWDERRRRLFCARDRLGIKPFHYAWHRGVFLFASEIKGILAAGYPAEPDWSTWATYLNTGYYDHTESTFFSGVKVLPGGHTLTLEDGRATVRSYWDLPALAGEPIDLPDEEAAARLRELIDDAVKLRLRSDVPLGVNLSGGLDSASLMSTVDRLVGSGEVKTFTATFDDPVYDEKEFASDVPHQNEWSRHFQRFDDNEVWKLAEQALWHQEAPFGGIATLAYHNLHSLAKEAGVTVLLEGQGVDEMLAGYSYFKPYFQLDLLEQKRWSDLRTELKANGTKDIKRTDSVRRIRMGVNSPLYQDGTQYLAPECISLPLRDSAVQTPEFDKPFSDHLKNALYRDLRYTKLPRVLRMNDRLSMAFSRELREPYLDHRIVEFLFRIPGSQKIRFGQGKYLLRKAMTGRLPDQIRLSGKRAVVTPQREWFRGALRSGIQAILDSSSFARREIFDVSAVRSRFKEFCNGGEENSFFVWQWVNTELWFRRFIDGSTVNQ